MGRIEKAVFISYRRTNFYTALAVYQDLTQHGYDVFFDYQSIDSGDFEKVIIENIKAKAHFLVILSPSALERCNEPRDWLRREIETAMDEKRNIIPLMMEGFDFGSPAVIQALSGKLAELNHFNGLRLYADYFFDAMEKLRNRFLKVEVEDARLHPLSYETKEINETNKSAASKAARVEVIQLTAEEWFERGFKSTDLDEKIRYYTEVIRLKPNSGDAYNNRAAAYHNKGAIQLALNDYDKAIELFPNDSTIYLNRGGTRRTNKDFDGALTDYDMAIRLNPKDAEAHNGRGIVFKAIGKNNNALSDFQTASKLNPKDGMSRAQIAMMLKSLGREEEAKEQEILARPLMEREDDYNRACFEAIFGNKDIALKFLTTAFKKKPGDRKIAQRDLDFQNLRDDPRFKALVEE